MPDSSPGTTSSLCLDASRNAPGVVNSALYEWTNWGGRFAAQWELPTAVVENGVIMNGTRLAVAHRIYDHTSILKMIEWRWHLDPLALRDAHARNLAEVLEFKTPNYNAPSWDVPSVVAVPCATVDPAEVADWMALRDHAVREGFKVP